jgi:hypothetical protein
MLVYKETVQGWRKEGYVPFVAIVEWPPQERAAAIAKFYEAFPSADREGLRGVHAWNLIGRNTMIVIAWTNSAAALEEFSLRFTMGTGLTMEICPAIDHESLVKALGKPKPAGRKTSKAGR